MLSPYESLDAARAILMPVRDLTLPEWNPRIIRTIEFENLCQSILADPAMLWRRPAGVQLRSDDGTQTNVVYMGSQRCRALLALFEQERFPTQLLFDNLPAIPAVIDDISDRLAYERGLRDNVHSGEWQDEQLRDVMNRIMEQGGDVETLGIPDAQLRELLADLSPGDPADETPAPDVPFSQDYVDFAFGDYRGKVQRATYDRFVARYQTERRESGAAMLDDVLTHWLDLSGTVEEVDDAQAS